ncbi:TRAP transporter small permease [Sedimentibacter hydroxybenzoicus DSM 7310]|uniref:TRAP transporter small permease n=1 Tax=Sedimentibacter hydroxybenzoicus DSM 7310 TaxID=1123245 RepID=A0A974BN13_SEDHY|nr:TRAP transporter small permease [Sedimentibacter hydroxybenzoicus]NYB75871.1 TRAP transporter small permease [Sedimentibacter hydroxybenzoicus DSM 7310]
MNKFFTKTLSRFEEFVLSYSVILMAILLIVGVFMRNVMNKSLTFSEEVASALLILVSFFGLGYCARKGRHITMSIVFDMVSNKYKKLFMIVISFVSALATAYITFLAARYIISVQSLGRVTPALQIPIYMIYSVVPLGFLLATIEYIRSFIFNITDKDNFYLTSDIRVPLNLEVKTDLSNLIDKLEEEKEES